MLRAIWNYIDKYVILRQTTYKRTILTLAKLTDAPTTEYVVFTAQRAIGRDMHVAASFTNEAEANACYDTLKLLRDNVS